MSAVEQVVAGIVAFIILRDIVVVERQVRRISDQIVELKIIIDHVKNAIGDNAWEEMLSKPIRKPYGSFGEALNKGNDK